MADLVARGAEHWDDYFDWAIARSSEVGRSPGSSYQYVVLLTRYGVSTTAALGVALLIRLLMMFFSLLGGLISLRWNLPKLAESG